MFFINFLLINLYFLYLLYMAINYYNKYIKYKVKYLSLLNQSGGKFTNISLKDNTISYKKDIDDHIIILNNIKEIIYDKPIIDIYKVYIIDHYTKKDFEDNLAKLIRFVSNKFQVYKKNDKLDSFLLQVSGSSFKILSNIDQSKTQTYGKFYFTIPAKENFDKLKLFVNGNISGYDDKFIKLLEHQKLAFDDLRKILNYNPNCNIIIPGEQNGDKWDHALGKGTFSIAKNSWQINIEYYKIMIEHLDKLVNNLFTDYPDRISYGHVGYKSLCPKYTTREKSDYKFKGDPSRNLIHVWGANDDNYNILEDCNYIIKGVKQELFGGGQAACFNIQKDGVYGIITMPISDIKNIVYPRNYMKEYYSTIL